MATTSLPSKLTGIPQPASVAGTATRILVVHATAVRIVAASRGCLDVAAGANRVYLPRSGGSRHESSLDAARRARFRRARGGLPAARRAGRVSREADPLGRAACGPRPARDVVAGPLR